MSKDVRRRTARLPAMLLIGGMTLSVAREASAQDASELPPPAEPWLAEPGDWAADFNDAQIACYQGSMRACDSIWLSERVLMDSFLSSYGRSCGGRVDEREIRRANLTCEEAFPGNE